MTDQGTNPNTNTFWSWINILRGHKCLRNKLGEKVVPSIIWLLDQSDVLHLTGELCRLQSKLNVNCQLKLVLTFNSLLNIF